jgi:aquaporin Z
LATVKSVALQKYVAEFIGTLVLVLTGCGSAVFAASFIGNLGVAFAFGLAVLVMVYTIGFISGCHINPAISIAMLAAGRLSAKDTVFYVIFQCIGGIMGAFLIYIMAVGNPAFSLAVNGLAQNGYGIASPAGYNLISCFVAEILLSFIFILVVLGATSLSAPKGFAGIAIGLSLTLVHLVLIPLTNASVNPARSLGPAVVMLLVDTTAFSQLWLFFVGPIIGGLLAALVWRYLGKQLVVSNKK